MGTVFIETYFGVSTRQVTNWEKKGLEKSEYSLHNQKLFELNYLLAWHSNNISKLMSKKTKGVRSNQGEESDKDEADEN